ncbi:probable glycosyltransferase, type 1 [Natronomonas pharaonis DSM 2160]|uniref:Probable glycosyltransferase, type 1 n=1 Tax=Natronomonas pharaonis (strain ATCC 35678 / DSM 2160 / CIP 103997 / JCM 8858 / NBRC 14720 / NCIMB 2260 / Gabara) TaxID=348780 RepID=A0A1U7EVJ1_NATPD|nr:glycosyltransferase [Natronomonas pharaonis]CAI49052.2 probable glycosyltransferase, type 1 [Natronomonas pharaonis DSM 2160]
MSEPDDVCVVTHPIGSASESHAETLLDILGAITDVSLVAISVAEESPLREEYDTIEVSRVGTGGPIPIAALRFLANQVRMAMILRRRPEEVVLFFGVTAYLLPIVAAKLAGKTVVLQPRGNVPLTLRLHWERRLPDVLARGLAGVVWSMERLGYHAADAIITYTPSMAEELGLDRFEEKLYPNGARYVDTDEFYPRVPFEERDRVVGFLGRLDEEKNVRTLAAVAKELPEDVTFRFIGDGDLREELEEELAAEIEAGKVEFTGWVDHDEVPRQLSELRLLVLPSEPTEGLPTVILEAMACGTPVLATPVSGVPDVVRQGETSFLMDEVAGEAIARDIEGILDRDDLTELSQYAREHIKAEYSFDAAVRRWRRVLEAL